MATFITVTRDASGWRDRFRAYAIIVDGQAVASIRRGDTERIAVTPGRHEIQLAVDWGRSHALALDLPEGAETKLRCRPNTNQRATAVLSAEGAKSYIVLEPEM